MQLDGDEKVDLLISKFVEKINFAYLGIFLS